MAKPHPIIAELFAEKDRLGVTYNQLARRAGVAKSGLEYWNRGTRTPGLVTLESALQAVTLESALQAVGLELVVRRRDQSS